MGAITSMLKDQQPSHNISTSSRFGEIMEFATFDPVEDNGDANGYYLAGNYVPEDVLIVILSHVNPVSDLLNCRRVCKVWNCIVQSHTLWNEIHQRMYKTPAKQLPWYLFYTKFATKLFDHNHIKNGNGQNNFDHWVIKPVFAGDGFSLEKEPHGAQPLPDNVPEFNGHKSCFATSFGMCSKQQIIRLKDNRLHRQIINEFKPTIYASEWYAPRFDCSCMYQMIVTVVQTSGQFTQYTETRNEPQWTDAVWNKVEMHIQNYPDDLDYIVFQHEGHDMLYWKGHYGSKMAGASMKFLFDSIDSIKKVENKPWDV